jgi:molybdate transport system ATP-binding protein
MLEVDVSVALGAFRLEAAFRSDAGVTCLFGRSGSGKSTLVNAIAGLVTPARGRLSIHGEVVFDAAAGIDVPVHRRRIGCVFQEGRLLPHLTVRQNLLYGHRLVPVADRHTGPDRIIDLLGLGALLDRRPAALSGGEKQRVAIGRALLASPRLLLMDEPLAALDAPRKEEILRYIERMHAAVNVPIVYVSHAIDEVVRLADRVVVLAEGKVVSDGPVVAVMGQPGGAGGGAPFEGGAVIEARVAGKDPAYDMTTLAFPGGELHATGIDVPVGQAVRVRVRARDVAIALERPQRLSVVNIIEATVVGVAPRDGAADVLLNAGGTTIRARITRRSADQLGLAAGMQVFALVKAIALDRGSAWG